MSGQSRVRVRFAPSPTGYLHVGGARTALFNWLFCRKQGGRFVLRIEDTDVQRNLPGAEAKLLDDLRWLGIDWDEGPDVGGAHGPYRQSERRHLYEAARDRLLDSGQAYYAFETQEELEERRAQALARKRRLRYARPETLPTQADANKARAEGRHVVVRFKAPQEPITIHDEILGDVEFGAGEIEDFVLMKSNGWPTYHFAVVVDDAEMGITHVLRAQEHLMNTPKHVLLQRALGYDRPKYAHLPLVFNADGSKMSKRDKHKAVRQAAQAQTKRKIWTADDLARVADSSLEAARRWLAGNDVELDAAQIARVADALGVPIPEIDVHDFRVAGYLPEALLNFIALIGWSPGDDREKLTVEELIEAFSLERIIKTSGRFDREKLLAMNTDWCASAPPERLLEAFKDWTQVRGSAMATLDYRTMARVLDACKGFRTLADVAYKAGILFVPDERVEYDVTAVKKVLAKQNGAGFMMLERFLPVLESIEPWTAGAVEDVIKSFCAKHDAKFGDVAQPVRVAVTGRSISPAIGVTLELLGKEKTLSRIRSCLSHRP